MNKYLLMSAAATVAATMSGVAQAATTVNLNSFCDYFVINNTNGSLVAAQHVGAAFCSSTRLNDPGLYHKKEGVPGHAGKKAKSGAVVFGDTTWAYAGVSIDDALDFVLGTPYGSSSEWAILVNSSGSSTYVLNQGQEDHVLPGRPNSHKSSIADALKAIGK
ncbi:MAG TPA: hypothetical protein VHY79_13495 [Rhizomicrobium sp.]|jgi:hypothetical protein|nr:hypothetical protein [Rhizomicrobium sp.]